MSLNIYVINYVINYVTKYGKQKRQSNKHPKSDQNRWEKLWYYFPNQPDPPSGLETKTKTDSDSKR